MNDSILSENWEIQSDTWFPEENITLVISLIVSKLWENFTSNEWRAVETFMSKFARRDTRPSVVQNRADVFLQRPNMSELRLPYYSTPSLCWYPKWPKFPHCIANSRPPPSSPDLAENITSKVLVNTRQATTVLNHPLTHKTHSGIHIFWCFRFEKWPLERETIWRHEEKEMMWSRPPPTFLPPNQTTAPWWAVDQWRKQENRRKSELQIWFISEWIQVKNLQQVDPGSEEVYD